MTGRYDVDMETPIINVQEQVEIRFASIIFDLLVNSAPHQYILYNAPIKIYCIISFFMLTMLKKRLVFPKDKNKRTINRKSSHDNKAAIEIVWRIVL